LLTGFRFIGVLNWNELIWLLVHLALNQVKFCQKAFLRTQNHVKLFAIIRLNHSPVVEHFALAVLRDVYLLDLAGDQVSIKEIHVGYFIQRLICYGVDTPQNNSSSKQGSNEALWFRVSFWVKEIVLKG
jgi:hypothetical protein